MILLLAAGELSHTLASILDTPATLDASSAPADDPVLVGAGDIAGCKAPGAAATAALLDTMPGTVVTLGDNAYPSGSVANYAYCYGPTWGRHLARTRPALGNHDRYPVVYFDYFGAAAGEPRTGYYSYDLGAWHVVVLDSNCGPDDRCGPGSPQEQWLRADLAAHPARCTLAYWHHPRFSSGKHGNTPQVQPFWQALYEAGADVALAGHDHLYERFAPQDPAGAADPVRGIRQFTVGTGGESHTNWGQLAANSEVRNNDTFGVLKLVLHPSGYDWQFIPAAGQAFTDAGSDACH